MIIGSVCQKDALRSCCLTCRAWLHASGAGLYDSVTLGPDRADVRRLFEAIQSSPILANYVHEFVLAFDEDEDKELVEFTSEELEMLGFILAKSARLRRLGFYGSIVTIAWPDAATFQLPRMELVHELEVVDVCFPSTESLLFFFVSSLPNVRSIIAEAVRLIPATGCIWPATISSTGVRGASSLPIMPSLQCLDLGCFDTEPYRLFFSSDARKVEVLFSYKWDISLFCTLFRDSNTAASVHHLSLASHISAPVPGEPFYSTGLVLSLNLCLLQERRKCSQVSWINARI